MLCHLMIAPLLACMAVYWLLPRSESSLLVLLELKTPSLSQAEAEYLGNIRFAFKIQRNIDDHMGDVDIAGKDKFNFALVTKNFPREKESLRFGDSLKNIRNINKFQVLPFTTSNKAVFLNSIIFLKRQLFMLAPSLAQTFPSLDLKVTPLVEREEEEEQGVFEELCTEQRIAMDGPVVIINVIKIRDAEVFAKYSDLTLFQLFPAVDTKILLAGDPRGDYWDMVALMEYASNAAMCLMAQSEEYSAALPHKIQGLQDTQTYLARRVPVTSSS